MLRHALKKTDLTGQARSELLLLLRVPARKQIPCCEKYGNAGARVPAFKKIFDEHRFGQRYRSEALRKESRQAWESLGTPSHTAANRHTGTHEIMAEGSTRWVLFLDRRAGKGLEDPVLVLELVPSFRHPLTSNLLHLLGARVTL